MTFTLRSARADDLPALHELEIVLFGDHAYAPSVLRQYFDILSPDIVVADMPGRAAAGYGLGAVTAADPTVGWVLAYGVHPEGRGMGIGGAILNELLARLSRRGVQRVRATVSPKNAASIRTCERAGFKEGPVERDYMGPGEDRVIMEWGREPKLLNG